MKTAHLLPAVVLAAAAVSLVAQQKEKPKGQPKLTWRVQQLHKDNNEGLALGEHRFDLGQELRLDKN